MEKICLKDVIYFATSNINKMTRDSIWIDYPDGKFGGSRWIRSEHVIKLEITGNDQKRQIHILSYGTHSEGFGFKEVPNNESLTKFIKDFNSLYEERIFIYDESLDDFIL